MLKNIVVTLVIMFLVLVGLIALLGGAGFGPIEFLVFLVLTAVTVTVVVLRTRTKVA